LCTVWLRVYLSHLGDYTARELCVEKAVRLFAEQKYF
jgi:hypothetical protein